MLTSPTAILIDSDCGWVNAGVPAVTIFNEPSFSLYSKNGTIHLLSPDSNRNYEGDPRVELENFLREGFVAVGYISYEYSRFTNQKFKPIHKKKEPFGYDTYFHFFSGNEITTCSYEEFEGQLNSIKPNENENSPEHISNFSKEEYLSVIEKVKSYISSGDIYQANISQKFTTLPIYEFYSVLKTFYEAQPVPFSAMIKFDDHVLLSGSMELFLSKKGNKISTRPIKGTAKRSSDSNDDLKIRKQLAESAKEKAENLMIVDLMRNDLGRICETGSVSVKNLFKINEYRTLYQMESEIEGVLKNDIDLSEIISSTFPPGSVTGAPKSRALEIIDELEPHTRGPYCGAFGVFYPGSDFTLSVSIRIIHSTLDTTSYWVGGGIVWDSDPEKEYEETLLKAKAIRRTLS